MTFSLYQQYSNCEWWLITLDGKVFSVVRLNFVIFKNPLAE